MLVTSCVSQVTRRESRSNMWLLLHAPLKLTRTPRRRPHVGGALRQQPDRGLWVSFPTERTQVSEGRRMPRGVRTHAGRARSEHLAPRSQGWSRSEGCPPTLRRASEHLGGSPQGPQCQGAGTERLQHRPQGTQFIVIWKNRTSRCPCTSCWRPTRFLKRADKGRESNARPVSSRRHSSGSQGCWLGLVLSSGMV